MRGKQLLHRKKQGEIPEIFASVGCTEIRLKEKKKIYSYRINISAFRGSESKFQVQRKPGQ